MLKQLKKVEDKDLKAIIKTNMGEIKLVLFPEECPMTVENFTKLAESGYYEGVIFHRVIPDFMIQGGDPTGTGRGGQSVFGHPFKDEFHPELRNIRGALSMANAGPGTNGSQFFIVQLNTISDDILNQMSDLGEEKGYGKDVVEAYRENGGAFWLDFKHTVFGHVYEGMEVVDEISKVERDAMDKPYTDVVIEKVEIIRG